MTSIIRRVSFLGMLSASLLGCTTLIGCTDSSPFLDPVALECDPEKRILGEEVKVRFEPRSLTLAPGQRKKALVVVDPDYCDAKPVSFSATSSAVTSIPEQNFVEFHRPSFEVEVVGREVGQNAINAIVATDIGDVTATLDVEVMAPTYQPCDSADDVNAAQLQGGTTASGAGTLASASITLPERADAPNAGTFLWSVPSFETSIRCADDIVPAGHIALGAAVSFGPDDKRLPRDLPMSIPVNPARMPESAHFRHLGVAYTGPAHREPRIVPVTDPLMTKVDGEWRLSFRAPRLGTYQAVVSERAGTIRRTRRITHRAIIGISMGGAGTMQIGLRHHHLFDVVAAMGGPVDWTWLIDHVANNHLGGFPSIAPGTVLADIALEREVCDDDGDCNDGETCMVHQSTSAGILRKCTLLPETDEPYEHASTFNNWWFEFPAPQPGHGGDFARRDHSFMFRDLALMFGNPFSYNPDALHLPAGADVEHPAYKGDRAGDECQIYVKPYEGPDEEAQSELWNACPAERCATPHVLENYYDDEYNPDGTFPVITFCDGGPKVRDASPHANVWLPRSAWEANGGNEQAVPIEAALAVDYNGNGVRDEMEPVIRSGHEPWSDWGVDGTPSSLEPGYGPDNLDPSGDDYDPRYNPRGSEGNARYEVGEPFEDVGLDGVANTASSPYDHGEGDAVFSLSEGLQRFWDYDARSMVRGQSDALMSTPLDDEALARVDFWTDGGTRDLFNFVVASEHFTGNFVARGRQATTIARPSLMPGLDPDAPDFFNPAHIVYSDLPGVVNYRYGADEPTEQDIESGAGQHVGTLTGFTNRLQSALYFIDSRWPDAPRTEVPESDEDPIESAEFCEVLGSCTFEFTSSFGRNGPVQITLPPGYSHTSQQEARYPVIYLLHGYGMTPEDLGAAILFLSNWMNNASDSEASRLGKAIIVYADGRCRTQGGQAECVNGSFFADSIREEGLQADAWFLELLDHIDQNYRTMPESTVDWVE